MMPILPSFCDILRIAYNGNSKIDELYIVCVRILFNLHVNADLPPETCFTYLFGIRGPKKEGYFLGI